MVTVALSILFGVCTLGIPHALYACWANGRSPDEPGETSKPSKSFKKRSSEKDHSAFSKTNSTSSEKKTSSSQDKGKFDSKGSTTPSSSKKSGNAGSTVSKPKQLKSCTHVSKGDGLDSFYQKLEECVSDLEKISVFTFRLGARADDLYNYLDQNHATQPMNSVWVLIASVADSSNISQQVFQKRMTQNHAIQEGHVLVVWIKESFANNSIQILNGSEVFEALRNLNKKLGEAL